MIDNIHLYRLVVLDTKRFSNEFYQIPCSDYTDTWNIYKYSKNGVMFSYSTRTHKLKIEGRLYTLCRTNNLVGVLGELWAGVTYDTEHQDLDDILDIVNGIIHNLTGYRLNIQSFKVSYIEICFNLTTSHVNDYIKLFNHKFLSDKKSQYKSYVNELDKQLFNSFYIKTGTDYKNNTNNKVDQLRYMKSVNKGYEFKMQVTEKDLKLAENVLRLEVQCGYQFLRNLRIERNITRLVDFLDIDLCEELIEEKYKYFIDKYGQLNFHTYTSAISICNASNLSKQDINKLCDYCLSLSKGYAHKI